MDRILHYLTNKQLVVFAGAGISMGAPANLPGWFGLNDLLMQTLWDRLQKEYRVSGVIRSDFMDRLKARRDINRFPPDYQAQIMEDQAGIDYFRSLSSVDADVYNPAHHHIARLAKHGYLKGIITTNFDTMLERSFSAMNVPYQSFYDNTGYDALTQLINKDEPGFIPIIKIHGTATDPASMVDTLKQRLKGRSQLLNNLLQHYLERYYFLYTGFSGADLDFDPEYIGIRKAAPVSPGFTYVYRKGSKVRRSINTLMELYGEKTNKLESDADELFEGLATKLSLPAYPYPFGQETPTGNPVQEKLTSWVDSIEPMKAVNMVNALAESLGIETASRALMDRVWKDRNLEDYNSSSFPIFLRNLGKSYVFNFQTRQERADLGGIQLATYTTATDSSIAEYYQNFGKGALHHQGNFSTATGYALFSLMKCFEGNRTPFKNFPHGFLNYEHTPGELEQADIIYYYSFYIDLHADYTWMQQAMELSIDYSVNDRDWMREGFARVRYAKLLATIGAIDLAKEQWCKGLRLAYRLHDDRMYAEALLAKGVIQQQTGALRSSLWTLRRARNLFRQFYRLPQLISCNIELLQTIFSVLGSKREELKEKAASLANEIREESEQFIMDHMQGFEPAFCYYYGMLLYGYSGEESREKALEYLADAYNLGVAYEQSIRAQLIRKMYEKNNIWELIQDKIKFPVEKDEAAG